MKASVVDLRYKMNDVLKALGRNEKVTVLYHGKAKGVIIPMHEKSTKKISEHPFFNMTSKATKETVLGKLDKIRGSRYNDI